MNNNAFVFISGCQRSGKTLVQLILSSHPDIVITPGTRCIEQLFFRYKKSCLLLNNNEIGEFTKLLRNDRKLAAWQINHELLYAKISRLKYATIQQIIHLLLTFFRDTVKPKAGIIGNKKGFYSVYGIEFKSIFPKAKYVFLIRDARAAVCSILQNQADQHDIVSAVNIWKKKATHVYNICKQMPDDCFMVRYERFVTNPESECKRLCRFLSVDYTPQMLSDFCNNNVFRHSTDKSHPGTYKPVTDSMIDVWKQKLDKQQIAFIEQTAKNELSLFNYF